MSILQCLDSSVALPLTDDQAVDHYLATIMDGLSVKQGISLHLLTRTTPQISEAAVMDLLSHLILMLGDKRLPVKASQVFAREGDQVQPLRSMLSGIMDRALTLSRQFLQTPTSE